MGSLSQYLKSNGIRPSVQRLKIYEYLYNNRTHPTVDNVYNHLSSDMPTLSKTTVYNTLKLFVLKGVVVVLNVEGNEARYDADTSLHGHFKCKGCGNVYDIMIDKKILDNFDLKEMQIDEIEINFKGYCKVCRN